MYTVNTQNDDMGLVMHENCKSKQVTDFIAMPSRCHDTTCAFRKITTVHVESWNVKGKHAYFILHHIQVNNPMLYMSFSLLYMLT